MNADEAIDAAIATELDRLALPLADRGPLAPRDEGVDGALEVAVVDVVEKRKEVVVSALRYERRVALAPCQTDAIFVDVVAQRSARVSIAPRDVANQGVDDRGRRVEEHVVDADVERAPLDPVRDDRVAIVGDRQDHRSGEGGPQLALQRL